MYFDPTVLQALVGSTHPGAAHLPDCGPLGLHRLGRLALVRGRPAAALKVALVARRMRLPPRRLQSALLAS